MDNSISVKLTYLVVSMPRVYKRLIMVAADLIALPLALWSSYALRLSEWWPSYYLSASWWFFLVVPIAGVYIFMRLGLYRAVVRFMGAQAIWAVVKGVLLLAVLMWAIAFLWKVEPFPRSIPISFALSALVYVGGSRLLVRHYYHWIIKHCINKDAVLIYGAGGAGIQLSTALSDGREYYPVGFIDDEKSLWGATIKGLTVHSPYSIHEVVRAAKVKHVLLAVPRATNKQRKQMLDRLENLNIHVQTIPSMPELLTGEASIEQLREVQIEDLLGRDPVPPMSNLMSKCIKSKVVMITGAGGSIGSELCRQVIRQSPKVLLLFDVSEFALYNIEHELKKIADAENLSSSVVALLGATTDKGRVARVLKSFAVDTIYHAAAYKHVPLVEHNVIEGVMNNVFGTQVIAKQAADAGVRHFILVSTDKAVRPTNIMGASKRLAELILQDLATRSSKTIFSMVRFGNVLGSSGSVVPLFRKQIRDGGPITVTHKDITRYFMTIPEAAALVVQAGSMAKGGEVFVLDMGEPVKIADLARHMVHLSGLELKTEDNPDGDIEITFTGLRPAEKLYEELLVGDDVIGTEHTKIMQAREYMLPTEKLFHYLDSMHSAADEGDCGRVRELLGQVVSEYKPYDELVDHLLNDDDTNRGKVISLR